MNMVQGKHAQQEIKAECAQYLMNACQYLIEAKPQGLKFCKVACVIVQPDMFAGEICLYLDEDYFNAHTLSAGSYDPQYLLADRLSLAKNWRLQIPDHMPSWTKLKGKILVFDVHSSMFDCLGEK